MSGGGEGGVRSPYRSLIIISNTDYYKVNIQDCT